MFIANWVVLERMLTSPTMEISAIQGGGGGLVEMT